MGLGCSGSSASDSFYDLGCCDGPPAPIGNPKLEYQHPVVIRSSLRELGIATEKPLGLNPTHPDYRQQAQESPHNHRSSL